MSDSETLDASGYIYQDGLPSDPILPLAFINRSFLNAVRSLLYGRQILIRDMYQASLLLRTLQSPIISGYDIEPDADDEDTRQRQALPHLVRHIAIDVRKTISIGRGGGSVIIDIIKLCPRLEHFLCSPDWMRTAYVPLQTALKGCSEMKAVALRGGGTNRKEIVWSLSTLEPLVSGWKCLEGERSVHFDLLPSIPTFGFRPADASSAKFSCRVDSKAIRWASQEIVPLSSRYQRFRPLLSSKK